MGYDKHLKETIVPEFLWNQQKKYCEEYEVFTS